MQNEERNKLEERIMAYFDGSLDEKSAAVLLAEVESSPAAQELFASHESLNALISSARVPLETPAVVNRSLAERIPGILEYLPPLAGGLASAPIIAERSGSIFAVLSKMSMSTAMWVGGSVALVATVGVLVKSSLTNDASTLHHNATSSAAAPGASPMPQAPVNSVTPEAGKLDASADGANAAGTSSDVVSHRDVSKSNSSLLSAQGKNATSATIDRNDIASARRANSSSVKSSDSKSSSVAAHAARLNSERNAEASDINSEADRNPTSNGTPVRSQQQPAEPMLSTVTPRLGEPANTTSAKSGSIRLTGEPLNFGPKLPFRFGLDAFTRYVMVPKVHANRLSQNVSEQSQFNYDAATVYIDYPVSEQSSLQAHVGYTRFMQITPNYYTEGLGYSGSVKRQVRDSYLASTQAFYTTAGYSYLLNPEATVRLLLGAEAGVAWLAPLAPMAGVSISADWDIAQKVTLRPSFSYDAVLVRSARDHNEQQMTGVMVDRSLKAQNVLNSMFGVSVGLMFHF